MDVGDIFLWGLCLCGYRCCWANDDNGQRASYQSLTGGVRAEYHPIAVFQKEVVENHVKKEQKAITRCMIAFCFWRKKNERTRIYD